MLTLKVGKMVKFFIVSFLIPLRLWSFELKVGDVLLQPLDCWSCSLIEAQENSVYSHMGVIIETHPTVLVAEALGSVRIRDLSEFNARTSKRESVLVLRLQDRQGVDYLQDQKFAFQKLFKSQFENLKYDQDFLWDNYDEKGNEKLYCSEMVTKLLNKFLGVQIPRKHMMFDINREQWILFFKGLPPDGHEGNSPATFEKSNLFFQVGYL